MQDYRCNACAKLLFRLAGSAVVAVKCPRCKTLNTLNATERPERLERLTNLGRSHEKNL